MWQTLRGKFTIITISVAVIVLLLGTVVTLVSSTRALANQARTYAELLAQQVVLNVQTRWQSTGRDAFLAALPSITQANNRSAIAQVVLFDDAEHVAISSQPTEPVIPLTAREKKEMEEGRNLEQERTLDHAQWMQVLTPLWEEGEVVGAVRVLTSMRAIQDLEQEEEYLTTILALGCAGGLLVGLRMFFTSQVSRPLAQLTTAMKTAEDGNLQTRVEPLRVDEIGQLGENFNRMLARLEASDSENRTLNARLQEFNERLEHCVQEVTRDLVDRNQELLRLQREMARVEPLAALGQVTGMIAHELGTPLNSVLGYCQLLAQGDLPEDVRESLSVIESQTRRMTETIRYYLARTRDAAHRYEQLSLNTLIQDTVSLLSPVFQQHHVAVRTELSTTLPIVRGELPALQRVLINVLNNAVDAVEESGTIVVSTRAGFAPGNGQPNAMIEVTDSGKGIPAEMLPKIFDLFTTTKSPDHGTGLGLAICQEIVKSHRGTITVASQPGTGTTVRIVLPSETGAAEHLPEKRV